MSLIDEFLGQSIASQRAKRGLTRTGLAVLLGVSEEHVAAMETGSVRASATQLLRVAEILKVGVESFFSSTPEVGPEEQSRPAFLDPEARQIVDDYNALPKPHRSALFAFLVESKLDGQETPTQMH